jgi:hypothetical protein
MLRHTLRPFSVCALLIASASGCSFDDAHLDDLLCLSDSDCAPGNVCIAQRCQADGAARDGGGDVDEPDVGRDADAAVDARDDSGTDVTTCPGSENVCGGCETLSAAPGSPCDEAACGVVVCDGADDVTCQARETNECGGCATLTASVGDRCEGGAGSACGGALACGGPDNLICDAAPFNACGGCEPLGGAPGDPCACDGTLDEAHTLSCDGDDALACGDDNGGRDRATELPESSDGQSGSRSARGGIVQGESEDWYQVFVRDQGGEALFPNVDLVGFTENLDLCAYWTFADARRFELSCARGSYNALDENTRGCCSAAAGSEAEGVRLRGGPFGVGQLDSRFGGDNDNGWLIITVVGTEATAECGSYELRYEL